MKNTVLNVACEQKENLFLLPSLKYSPCEQVFYFTHRHV